MDDKFPSLLDRIQSIFIDLLVLLLSMVIVSSVLSNFSNVPDWVRIFLFVSLFFLYEPLCVSYACTVGNLVKGIRVRSYNDPHRRINIPQALVRFLFKSALGWLSFVTIHADDNKRAIHDLISGSIVVRNQASKSS
jgi:uncharacterized RDD family membrane protein YckC